MATTNPRNPSRGRPPAIISALVLLGFLGLTSLGGGIEMLLFPKGNQYLPGEWIDGIPLIDSWVVPGLILTIGFGLGSLLVGWGLFRRPKWAWLQRVFLRNGLHWSWACTILIGLSLIVWIVLELVFIPKRSVVEVVYGTIGVALVVLPTLPSAQLYLRLPAAFNQRSK